MHDFLFGRQYWTRLAYLSIGVIVIALGFATLLGLERVSAEPGPLENAQEAFLLATMVFYAWAAIRQRHAGRLASVGAATLALVLFLRELEIPATGPVTAYLNSPEFRWHEAFVIVGLLGPYLIARWRLLLDLVAFLRTVHVVPFVLTVLLLLLGDVFDGLQFNTPFLATLIEEGFETLAYFAFALTGLSVLDKAREVDPVELARTGQRP